MIDLNHLHEELDGIRAMQSETASRLADIGAERFEIESAIKARADAVAAAEDDLVEQQARNELGEPSDVATAQKNLDAALSQAGTDDGGQQRLRVLDALKNRFDLKARSVHERALELMAEIKAGQIEILHQRADEIRNQADLAYSQMRDCASQAVALSSVLNSLGSHWPGQGLVIDRPAEPQQEAITHYRSALMSELSPA